MDAGASVYRPTAEQLDEIVVKSWARSDCKKKFKKSQPISSRCSAVWQKCPTPTGKKAAILIFRDAGASAHRSTGERLDEIRIC
jgi:hypothetical protein